VDKTGDKSGITIGILTDKFRRESFPDAFLFCYTNYPCGKPVHNIFTDFRFPFPEIGFTTETKGAWARLSLVSAVDKPVQNFGNTVIPVIHMIYYQPPLLLNILFKSRREK